MAVLVPCLVKLRDEVNELAVNRDKESDGWIGNAAHAAEVSDHNPDETGSVPIHDADHIDEVHAIDVDTDLLVPGLTMETIVQFLLARCRAGTETRLRYIIYYRRIWEASNDWRERAYTGASPHTEHGHFSASYESAKEASTASWHLEDIPVALTPADKTWISEQITQAVKDVWDSSAQDVVPVTNADGTVTKWWVKDVIGRIHGLKHNEVITNLDAANAKLDTIAGDIIEIKELVTPVEES